MAKRSASSQMNHTERVAGTVFFLVYLLALPVLAGRLFALIGTLLGVSISESLQNIIFYYLLFAVTLILFHHFLAQTTVRFFDNLGGALATLCLGLLVFYGANELLFRVCSVLFNSRTNLNDMAIAAQIVSAPRMTALIVVVLAPFVEETLFRGLVFGCIRDNSRVAAYVISCVLFALLHVLPFFLSSHDLGYLILMLQYLVPGLIFAWAFEHSGTLWTAILLHAVVNALSLGIILS